MPGPGLEFFGEEEETLVLDALRGRQMSRYRFDQVGDEAPSKVYTFEREFEAYLGVRHALGMNSCTSALFAGLRALGIGPGDEVLVPGYTFIASIAAVAYAGAVPVLCEIDDTLTIDPADAARRITPRTRAILAVHMLGAPCDLAALGELAAAHGLALVEDVAQACGGSFRGRPLGSAGAFGAFSLNVFKTITAGDGGVLTTSDSALYERAFAIHDHGARPFRLGVAEDDAILGLNLRMHELTGAVALAQVRKLPRIVETMRDRRGRLLDAIGSVPYGRPRASNDPMGDCATVAVWSFESAARAAKIASALGSKTLVESGKHYYGNMRQLLNRGMPRADACPFACATHPTDVRYRRGQLPRTDDLLARSIALSVGVSDSYLGSSFGIGVRSTDAEIATVAAELHRRIGEVA